jgi:predicted nucleic acid-binding protein
MICVAVQVLVRLQSRAILTARCFSFALMQQRGLTAALTSDHHFQQAGFEALLLEEPPA